MQAFADFIKILAKKVPFRAHVAQFKHNDPSVVPQILLSFAFTCHARKYYIFKRSTKFHYLFPELYMHNPLLKTPASQWAVIVTQGSTGRTTSINLSQRGLRCIRLLLVFWSCMQRANRVALSFSRYNVVDKVKDDGYFSE